MPVSTKPRSPELRASGEDHPPLLENTARTLEALCVVLALGLIFILCLLPIAVTDFWWQAKAGEVILRTGSIPRRDPFSWTAGGQPWQVHEWLTEVFFYLAYAHLPSWVLVFYKSGLGMIACGLVLVRAWIRSRNLLLAVAVAVAAGFVLRNYADLRPQMVSFVLMAGLLLALDEYHEGRLRWLPWALPPIFALWANLHGGVVVGFLALLIWVAGEVAGQWLFQERSPGLGPLAAAVGASSLAILVNPNGFHVYTYPFWVLGHPQVMSYIVEWYSPDFHKEEMRPLEYLLLATLGVLALLRGARPVRIGEALILVAMAHAALIAQRNMAAFAIVAAPVLAAGLAALGRQMPPLQSWRAALRLPGARIAAAASISVALVVSLVLHLPGEGAYPRRRLVPPDRWFNYTINWGYFPHTAAMMMEKGAWPGYMYNDYVWGGYLIWKLYPRRPVFVDGRAEVYYATRAFEDEMTIHNVADGWQTALDRRGVQVVLTSRWGHLARALARSPVWKLAFTGAVEVVYVRAEDPEPGIQQDSGRQSPLGYGVIARRNDEAIPVARRGLLRRSSSQETHGPVGVFLACRAGPRPCRRSQ
jgi:hypothetical protein